MRRVGGVRALSTFARLKSVHLRSRTATAAGTMH
jgi:hypothetical protein